MPKLAWRLETLLAFPRDFANYFQFNFGYRPNLISMHTWLIGETLHESTSRMVVEGKEGWLFLAENDLIEDYRGLLPFSEIQLQCWRQALESRHQWLARQGIRYLFVICPDKHTIYPEYMPDKINRVHTETRLDQLVHYMKKTHSEVDILDLRPALMELKQQHLCYQPQESHWNDVGAFIAYQQIARRLQTWYPGLRVLDMTECQISQRENPATDLLRLQGKGNTRTLLDAVRPVRGFAACIDLDPNTLNAEERQVKRSRRSDAPAGKLLMIHDSFGVPLVPFLAEHFREGRYIYSRGDNFSPAEVLACKPDVVVEEVVERRLCKRVFLPVDAATSTAPTAPPATAPSPSTAP